MSLKKLYTLVFLRKDREILLGMKKRGFGINKWNGFGGKVEQNESIIDGAARELYEESCVNVKPSDLRNVGHLEFTFEGDQIIMDVRVFTATTFEGIPKETEEMKPKWHYCEEIPYENMWPDDRYWFPYILKEKLFYGKFHYGRFENILDYKIEELGSMANFYHNKK